MWLCLLWQDGMRQKSVAKYLLLLGELLAMRCCVKRRGLLCVCVPVLIPWVTRPCGCVCIYYREVENKCAYVRRTHNCFLWWGLKKRLQKRMGRSCFVLSLLLPRLSLPTPHTSFGFLAPSNPYQLPQITLTHKLHHHHHHHAQAQLLQAPHQRQTPALKPTHTHVRRSSLLRHHTSDIIKQASITHTSTSTHTNTHPKQCIKWPRTPSAPAAPSSHRHHHKNLDQSLSGCSSLKKKHTTVWWPTCQACRSQVGPSVCLCVYVCVCKSRH